MARVRQLSNWSPVHASHEPATAAAVEWAERVLGAALRRVPRQAYYLHTKVGRYDADIVKRFDFTYERTLRSIDESLERLGVDYIDTCLLYTSDAADE